MEFFRNLLGRELHSIVSTRPQKISVTDSYVPSSKYERGDAYLVAGSFVKYLIEDKLGGDGKKFMEFYRSRNWQKHFGKSFIDLAKEWGKKVGQYVAESTDLIYIEHINARLKPTGELDNIRKERVRIITSGQSLRGGDMYPTWVDLRIESRTDQTVEFSDIYIDNIYKGKVIDMTYNVSFNALGKSLIASLIGKSLNPYESKLIRDFPFGTSSTWPGSQFVVHYIFRIPKLSNRKIDVPVITPKL